MPLLHEMNYDEKLHNRVISQIKFRGSISSVIEQVRNAWFDMYALNAEQINDGTCEDFARDVCGIIPGTSVNWDDVYPEIEHKKFGISHGIHAFVYYEEKYYDAEAPDGVDNWWELPLFTRERRFSLSRDLQCSTV